MIAFFHESGTFATAWRLCFVDTLKQLLKTFGSHIIYLFILYNNSGDHTSVIPNKISSVIIIIIRLYFFNFNDYCDNIFASPLTTTL